MSSIPGVPDPFDMDLSEHWGRTPSEVCETLAVLVANEMAHYGLTVHIAEATPVIDRWLCKAADSTGLTPEAVAAALGDLRPVAHEIAASTALSLAEERPGSDPWAHACIIPVPLPVAMVTGAGINVCEMIAIYNEASTWAAYARETGTRFQRLLDEQDVNDLPVGEMEILMRSGERGVMFGPITHMPQPATAYIARFFDMVADRVMRNQWEMPEELDSRESDTMVSNIKGHASMLRDLNARFGYSGNPTTGS